jgi:hypothetical protein
MSDTELVQDCRQVGETLKQALSWVADAENDGVVRQERSHLERQLRRAAFEVGLLAKAAERPMCVGVFGPSQAGKSYLVSVLARRGHTLTAVFDGDRPELDFLSDLNPSGGNESTGLVTRFTIHKTATPPGFPVHLRLLTQTDVVKILCNIYYNDADLEQRAGSHLRRDHQLHRANGGESTGGLRRQPARGAHLGFGGVLRQVSAQAGRSPEGV